MTRKSTAYRLRLEVLESRINPTAYRLDVVALHEFGHALGLEHHSNPTSIMHGDYEALKEYDISRLGNDPAVIRDPLDSYVSLLEIYTDEAIAANTTGWKDKLDPMPGNGVVDLSWSIMPDGTKIRKKVNIINATFSDRFGPEWVSILAAQLGNWASASQGRLSFEMRGDAGLRFDYAGLSQNDDRSGDLRIGAIPMNKLAQAYGPPPNGRTAPGDVHFNSVEDWMLPPPPPPPPPPPDFSDPDGDGIDMGDGGSAGGGSQGSGQTDQPGGAGDISGQSSTSSGAPSAATAAETLPHTSGSGNPVDGLFGEPFAQQSLI